GGDGFDAAVEDKLQLLDELLVARVAQGEGQGAALRGQRQEEVFPGDRRGAKLKDLYRHLEARQVEVKGPWWGGAKEGRVSEVGRGRDDAPAHEPAAEGEGGGPVARRAGPARRHLRVQAALALLQRRPVRVIRGQAGELDLEADELAAYVALL